MKWIGPYTIDELLDNCLNYNYLPSDKEKGIYLISEKQWFGEPTKCCNPLYVGKTDRNKSKKKRFRTRIGDLIADIFGFFGSETEHHSGGKSLHDDCKQKNKNPKELYIGWAEDVCCSSCAESTVYHDLKPLLNKKEPKCKKH